MRDTKKNEKKKFNYRLVDGVVVEAVIVLAVFFEFFEFILLSVVLIVFKFECELECTFVLAFEIDFAVALLAFIVELLVDFNRVFVEFGCFFGLAGGVFIGDLVDRALIEWVDPLLFDVDVLLIAPVFGTVGAVLALKLFWRGGEQPK